ISRDDLKSESAKTRRDHVMLKVDRQYFSAIVRSTCEDVELLNTVQGLIVPYMAPEPSKRRDRYDVTGNIEAEYIDADQTVLVNKKGITDLAQLQALEE